MTTPVVVPLRHYNLGNALSVLATASILAERIGGSCWFRQFEAYEELFEGQPSRQGSMTEEDRRFAGGRMTGMQMFSAGFREALPALPAIRSDEWFDYVEVAEDTLVVRRRRKYFTPLEAIDLDLLGRYRMVALYSPYQFSWQVPFDVGFLRERLPLRHDHVARAEEANGRARDGRKALVGVHVRLGDYREWRGGRYAFELDEVVRVLASLESHAPGAFAFRLFSNELDEIELGRLLAGNPGLRCVYEAGDALGDFCGLAGCDFVFGPPSSFGHWAAFLGGVPRVVFDDIALQRHVVSPRYLAALRPVEWPFSVGLANDFWVG